MSTLTDHLITRYSLQDDYTRQASRIASSTHNVAVAQRVAGGGFASMASGAGAASAALSVLGLGLVAVTAGLASLAVAASQAGFGLMQHAAEWDALSRALEAVEGSAAGANRELQDLREIAKQPGLGFREAIQGFVNLRRGGVGQAMAKDLLREFGNAIALGGGGKAELDRVMRAAMQIAVKPFLQGEELLQLTEAGIPAHKLVKNAFGTSDTEELKRRGVQSGEVLRALLAQMALMPRVAGGAKNTFENLGDALDYAKGQAGEALNKTFLPLVESFANAVGLATDAGVFATVMERISVSFEGLGLRAANMEGVLTSLAAGAMTAADGMQNLVGNIRGFLAMLDSIPEWIKMLSPVYRMGKLARAARDAMGIEGIGDTYARNLRIVEMEMELARKRAAGKKTGSATEPAPPETSVPYLARIATATEKSLEIDMRRYAFGGGDLGRVGVTPVEMGGILNRRAKDVKIVVPTNGPYVFDPAALVTDVLAQLKRQGMLRA